MANAPRFPVVSPIGRIVEGDPWTPQEKDGDGNPRTYKSGPNIGQPNPQYYIGLAVPKWVQNPQTGQMIDNPDFAAFYGFIDAVARKSWPNLFPNGGQCIVQDFSWKIRDGDGFVRKGKNAGKPLADRPGFKDHWIISFASSFAPQIVVETGPGTYAEITDKSLLHRGYYVRVGASVSSNESTNTPGLYVNLEKIELKGKGEIIHSGVSAAEVFAGAGAGFVPAGMQALTPMDLAGAPSGFGGAPAGGLPQPQMGGAPAFGGAPAAGFPQPQPQMGGAPAAGFPQPQPQFGGAVPNAGAPGPAAFVQPVTGLPGFSAAAPAGGPGAPLAFGGGAPGGPGAGAPMAGAGAMGGTPAGASPSSAAPAFSGFMGAAPVMLPAANGATYEQFIANGWNDAAMIQAGFMAAR